MKKVLVPICERDYSVTDKRFAHLIHALSATCSVEVLTISPEIVEDLHGKINAAANITVTLVTMKSLPLTLDFRTNLVKVFVQYTNDVYLPGTDLKLWKTAAFDDFWGHLSTYSPQEPLRIDADMVLLPLISYDDTPFDEMDVFYTFVLFGAKERGVKVVGYQLYPVFQGLKLMPLLMDALIVGKAYEKSYYRNMGIAEEKIYLLTVEKEAYALATIDDAYRNNLFNTQISIGRDELGVVVYNHVKFRPQVRAVIEVIGRTKLPVVLSLLKRDYTVKDLSEDVIIKDFYYEAIERAGCRFYLVEAPSTVPLVMISDVVVSPTYIAPVEFADRYRKRTIVYNPHHSIGPTIEGIGTRFLSEPEHLAEELRAAYQEKKSAVGIGDIVAAVLGGR